jgi:peptide/nickel transport system substrate-binding protein
MGFAARTVAACRSCFRRLPTCSSKKQQAIVKKALERLGIEVELKTVPGSMYFSGDPGNPDTYSHFTPVCRGFSIPLESIRR